MAEKTKIQDTKDSGFGKYEEANGGGTPQGGRFGGPNGRVGWKKRGEPGHRESQPRTKDGKFSYNSVNGKPLAPTSDPTRGKTVNPLLTGGKNGVKIEDVEKEFGEKKGTYWDKYKDSWYQDGSEATGTNTRGKVGVKVAGEAIWKVARRSYDSVKGEFTGESENWTAKAGSRSKEEKAAIQKQEATGQEQYVLNQNDNSIKTKAGTTPTPTKITPTWKKPSANAPAPAPAPAPTISPSANSASTAAPAQNQYLQAPTASNTQAGTAPGLSAANMAQLNALFGGSAPSGVISNNAPSLAGFKNFKKK